MSFQKAKEFFEAAGLAECVMECKESRAAVEHAAQDAGCEPARIGKSMSFLPGGKAMLIVTAQDAKIDNQKSKACFGQKAKMIPGAEVENYVGYAPGGVCPFVIPGSVKVYLDESLRRFDMVYPAALCV